MPNAQCRILMILLTCICVSCARPSLHAEALEEMTHTIRETTAILKEIHTADDARAAQGELMALSQRALNIKKKMNELIGTPIPTEAKRYTQEKLRENVAATREMITEASRLMHDPEIMEIIGASLKGFQGS